MNLTEYLIAEEEMIEDKPEFELGPAHFKDGTIELTIRSLKTGEAVGFIIKPDKKTYEKSLELLGSCVYRTAKPYSSSHNNNETI
jgi:hypothetical protein